MKTRENSERCISISEQVKNYAERFSRGHWTFFGPGYEKKWYGTLRYTPEGTWVSIATDGGTIQRNGSPSIQEHQCFEPWNSEKKGWREIPYISIQIHRTQNSCFAQFTQQISSVSTEHSQAGVKSSVRRLRIKKSRLRKSSSQKKMSSY